MAKLKERYGQKISVERALKIHGSIAAFARPFKCRNNILYKATESLIVLSKEFRNMVTNCTYLCSSPAKNIVGECPRENAVLKHVCFARASAGDEPPSASLGGDDEPEDATGCSSFRFSKVSREFFDRNVSTI